MRGGDIRFKVLINLFCTIQTDSEVSSTGFVATLSLERSVCGPSIFSLNQTHPQQTLSWPIGGGKYLANERCQWTFTAPYGNQIALSFDRLDIAEDVDNVHACDEDYLEVLDDGVRLVLKLWNSERLHNNLPTEYFQTESNLSARGSGQYDSVYRWQNTKHSTNLHE